MESRSLIVSITILSPCHSEHSSLLNGVDIRRFFVSFGHFSFEEVWFEVLRVSRTSSKSIEALRISTPDVCREARRRCCSWFQVDSNN